MNKVPMTAFAASIVEPGSLKVANQFTNLSRHFKPLPGK
jgi:hypothetical protein